MTSPSSVGYQELIFAPGLDQGQSFYVDAPHGANPVLLLTPEIQQNAIDTCHQKSVFNGDLESFEFQPINSSQILQEPTPHKDSILEDKELVIPLDSWCAAGCRKNPKYISSTFNGLVFSC